MRSPGSSSGIRSASWARLSVPVAAYTTRDRGEEQQRGQQRDHHVDGPGADPLAGAAQGDEHVRRGEQHLEPDEQVEQVAGEERVGDARGQHQVRGVEDRDRRLGVAVLHALRQGVHQHRERHGEGHREHQGRDPVGDQVDAHRRGPAAQLGDQRAGVGGHEQRHRRGQGQRQGDDADHALRAPVPPQRERQPGAEQRQHHGQRQEPAQVGGHSRPPTSPVSSCTSAAASSRDSGSVPTSASV